MINFREIVFTVSTVSDISDVLPFVIWAVWGKKETPFNILGVFFLVSAVIKIFTLITAELHINNMPAFHVLACWEMFMLFCFFSRLIYKRIIYGGVILLVMFNVLISTTVQNIFRFNSLAWTVDMILIIVLGMIYFFRIYKAEEDFVPLNLRPEFIITCGFLIYASGSLFTYMLGSQILSGKAEGFFKNAWFFQTISNILKNIIVSYGFKLTAHHE